jgi:hypothetical protein
MMGGKIDLDSKLGKGSTFCVELWADKVKTDALAATNI